VDFELPRDWARTERAGMTTSLPRAHGGHPRLGIVYAAKVIGN
jgi:hypothetical protein